MISELCRRYTVASRQFLVVVLISWSCRSCVGISCSDALVQSPRRTPSAVLFRYPPFQYKKNYHSINDTIVKSWSKDGESSLVYTCVRESIDMSNEELVADMPLQRKSMVKKCGAHVPNDKIRLSAAIALWSPRTLSEVLSFVRTSAATLISEFQQLTNVQKGMFLFIFLLGIRFGRSTRYFWRRFTNVADIPSVYFGHDAPLLKGRVVAVSDGDTIRFLHVPTPLHASRISSSSDNKKYEIKKKQPKMSEIALPVRVCTIDTPETAKFGKEGQPFGQEAKDYLASLVKDKMIHIRLLQKDQYGRIVAQVEKPGTLSQSLVINLLLLPLLPFFALWRSLVSPPKHVDELMLRRGLAEVYQGMGAVYGPLGKERYLQLQAEAEGKNIGIWSLRNRESAAEYKRRTK